MKQSNCFPMVTTSNHIDFLIIRLQLQYFDKQIIRYRLHFKFENFTSNDIFQLFTLKNVMTIMFFPSKILILTYTKYPFCKILCSIKNVYDRRVIIFTISDGVYFVLMDETLKCEMMIVIQPVRIIPVKHLVPRFTRRILQTLTCC